jgi:hypothetical protein
LCFRVFVFGGNGFEFIYLSQPADVLTD